jgi:CAAX protease family protein
VTIPCLFLAMGLVRGFESVLHIRPSVPAVEALAVQVLFYGFIALLMMAIFRVEHGQPFWRSLAWISLRLPPMVIVICGLLTAFGVAAVSLLLRTPATSNPLTRMLDDPRTIVPLAIFGLTLAPLMEELVFRGFLQPLVVHSLGAVPGVLVAAIPFGLLHFHEYGDSWRHVVLISLAGAAFGWMRHATGSTRAAVLMHASYNALFFFALFAQRKELPHLW